MEAKPPTPVSKSFLVCRRVILDTYTNEHVLISPIHEVASLTYPVSVPVSVFAQWTSVHGLYQLEFRLQDLEGEVLWRQSIDKPLEVRDPLLVTNLTLHNIHLFFTRPGKYDLVMLANGAEVVRTVFYAHLPAATPPNPEP